MLNTHEWHGFSLVITRPDAMGQRTLSYLSYRICGFENMKLFSICEKSKSLIVMHV